MVQVVCALQNFPVRNLRELLDRKVEERPVVRLELKDSSVLQELLVDCQKFPGREPPLRVPRFRPGILEIELHSVDLSGSEDIRQISGIHA